MMTNTFKRLHRPLVIVLGITFFIFFLALMFPNLDFTSLGFIESSDDYGVDFAFEWKEENPQVELDGLGIDSEKEPVAENFASDDSGHSLLGDCDLYHGKWVYNPTEPLYTNMTCPYLTQAQNCENNGRPDRDYESWRWKPDQCDLPRFDAKKFLEVMRGKTIAFVGDSLARNQMESMLCILSQVETPRDRGRRGLNRYYFPSTSTFLLRLASSWLVHSTPRAEKLSNVHIDTPDKALMELLPGIDVVVLSSGHWFSKHSGYFLLNGKEVDSVEAYVIATETALTTIANLPDYSGLMVLRSYSPDHYMGGKWNTGGSCDGITKPASELVRNNHTDMMHKKQIATFEKVAKEVRNGSKLRLMDITEMTEFRQDGHPGPYRSPGSHAVMKGGGRSSQDCLHWCMPGVVDTWNEILFEIIKREF